MPNLPAADNWKIRNCMKILFWFLHGFCEIVLLLCEQFERLRSNVNAQNVQDLKTNFSFKALISLIITSSPSERPKDPTPSVANNKQIPTITVKPSLSKSKTQISSIYTKLSSIKPTNANSTSTANSRNSSIPNYMNPKPVKTTQIGSSQASPTRTLNVANAARSPIKSPKRIPQLVKPSIVNGANKMSSKSLISFLPKSDDSNGNSATSSLSTSSSNSSLNANGNISPVRNFLWDANAIYLQIATDKAKKSIT